LFQKGTTGFTAKTAATQSVPVVRQNPEAPIRKWSLLGRGSSPHRRKAGTVRALVERFAAAIEFSRGVTPPPATYRRDNNLARFSLFCSSQGTKPSGSIQKAERLAMPAII
jgi:hypothetical protein